MAAAGAPKLSTRITSSATGLAKQILGAPEETTSELTNLRATHKFSRLGGGDASVERQPKALSIRQRNGKFGTSKRSPDTSSTDYRDEFDGWFLDEGSASSSRSVSPLEVLEEGRIALERDDSLDPEGFEAVWENNSSRHTDATANSSATASTGESLDFRHEGKDDTYFQPWDQRRLSQDSADKSWILGNSTPSLQETAQLGTQGIGTQQHRALQRLQLLYSHLPATTSAQRTATTTTSRNLHSADLETSSRTAQKSAIKTSLQDSESTFNQFCHTEDAQAWLEAGMSIGRIGQRSDWEQGLEVAETERMSHEFAVLEQRVREMPQRSQQRFIQASQRRRGEQGQQGEKERESMPEFRCPWVECYRRFKTCVDYIGNTDQDEGDLPCVHAGCEQKFEDEGTWRDHVFVAHHDLLPLRRGSVDMEGVWDRVQN